MGTFYRLGTASKLGEIVASLYDKDVRHVEDYDQVALGLVNPEILIGKIDMGSKSTYDAACADSVLPILFSRRVFDVLQSAHATGYKKCPIVLIDKKGNEFDNYSVLQVTGRSGKIDKSVAHPIVMPPPTPQGRSFVRFTGYRIDESNWDGSDVFVPDAARMVLITHRIAEELKRAKLNNVSITPIEEDGVYFSKEEIAPILGQAVFDELSAQGLVR